MLDSILVTIIVLALFRFFINSIIGIAVAINAYKKRNPPQQKIEKTKNYSSSPIYNSKEKSKSSSPPIRYPPTPPSSMSYYQANTIPKSGDNGYKTRTYNSIYNTPKKTKAETASSLPKVNESNQNQMVLHTNTQPSLANRKISQNAKAIEALNKHLTPLFLCSNKKVGLFFEYSEAIFYKRAQKWAAENNCVVFSKVRIADIIYVPIDNKFSNNQEIFWGIAQKHFDFVVFRPITNHYGEFNLIPNLIIEIDGTSHSTDERKERDELIDTLIENYNAIPYAKRKLTLIHICAQDLPHPDSLWEVIKCINIKEIHLNRVSGSVDTILSTYVNKT